MAKAFSVALVCVLFTVTAWTQVNATTLHAAFGQPTTETFNVAPDVLLTAVYDVDANACSLAFHRTAFTSYVDRDATTGELHALLDKVAPAYVRGEQLNYGISINGCIGSKQTRYENVVITETVFPDDPGCATAMRLEVGFTRKACVLEKASGASVVEKSRYH